MPTPNSQKAVNPILAAARTAVERASVKADVAIAAQTKSTAEIATTSEYIQESIQNKAKDVQLIDMVSGLAELEAQNSKIATYEAAGGIDFQKELMTAYVSAGKELIDANKELEAARDVPTTGLISYFSNLTKVNEAYYKAEGIEDKRDDIGETIAGINAAQESIARAVTTTKKTVNTATIDAGRRGVAEQANIDAAEIKLEAIRDNATALRSGMTADAQQVAIKLELVRLENTVTNQKAREAEAKATQQRHEETMKNYKSGAAARAVALEIAQEDLKNIKDPKRRELRQAKIDKELRDIESDKRVEAIYATNVQIGQAVTGNPIDEAEVVIDRKMNAGTVKERLKIEKLQQIGQREDNAFGLSVGDANETISITGADPSLPPVKLIVKLRQDYERTVTSDPQREVPKTQIAYNQELDAHAKPIISAWRREIKAGDASNPFQAPPMAVLIKRKAVRDSALFQKVPAFAEMKEFNAKLLYETAVAGIASKAITMEEAALGLETIFDGAVDHNNETEMFTRAGLLAQDSYITEIVEPPLFSERTTGATGGAALGVSAAAVAAAPVAASVAAVGSAAYLGSYITGIVPEPYPLVDSTKRVEIMNALTKLIAVKASLFGRDLF